MTRPLRLLAASPIVLVAAALVWHAMPASQAATTDWTEVWSDQFNGPAGQRLDPANWTPQVGTSYPGGAPNWGTGEVETATDSTANASTDGAGHAAIRAIREADGHWTSARVETVRTDFRPPPGGVLKFEASAKQPDVSGAEAGGIWPALWMLGAPARGVGATNWPSIGEADLLETANGRDSNWGTFHCGTWGGVCNEPDGRSSGERTAASLGLSSFKTSFHRYAIEWDESTSPQEMRWYIDGVLYHTVRATDMPADVWTNATNHGYFLVMDIAMGGGLADKTGGGPTAATKSGVPLLVDYFSVSSKPGSGTPTPTSTTATGTATVPPGRDTDRHRDGDGDVHGDGLRHRLPAGADLAADLRDDDESGADRFRFAVQPQVGRQYRLKPHPRLGRRDERELRRAAVRRPDRDRDRHLLRRYRPAPQHAVRVLHPGHDDDAGADVHHHPLTGVGVSGRVSDR